MTLLFIAAPGSVPQGAARVDADRSAVIEALQAVPSATDIMFIAHGAEAENVARAVRLAWNDERIGMYATCAPPTLFFAAAATMMLLPADKYGLVPAIEAALAQSSRTEVLLSSVSKLEDPNPKFWQHVMSLWPASRFLVRWNDQSVSRVKTLSDQIGPLAITARSELTWDDVDLSELPVQRVDLPTDIVAPWRSRRWVEVTNLVNYPEHIATSILDHDRAGLSPLCVSCGRSGAFDRCSFCFVPVDHQPSRAGQSVHPVPVGGNS